MNENIDERYLSYAKDVQSGKVVACKYIQQATARYLEYFSKYEFRPEKADRAVNFISKLRHTTGAHNGKPFKLQPYQQWIIYNIFGFYHKGTDRRVIRYVYIELARKSGKALSLDTKLYTPNGTTTMGDVKVGDVIIGADGKETTVTYTTPIKYDHNCYRVTFEDGETIVADADHNWYVKSKYERKELVKTTEELYPKFKHARNDGKGIEYLYRVPMNKPIEYSEKDYSLDPYILGLWLGDGHKGKPCFTVDKKDLPMYNCVTSTYGNVKIRPYKKSPNVLNVSYAGEHGKDNSLLRHQLIDLGVFKNKHIPNQYLYGSINQRLALLQGLMDTDGTVSKAGECEFVQKNKIITDGLCSLLSSLGIKFNRRTKIPKINGKICDEVERVTFFTDKTLPCFRLKRKYDRLKNKLNKRMQFKSITNIEKTDSVPVRCITVDNRDHLYLCGERCTVTHNTALAAAICLYMLIADGENGSEVEMVANSAKQAKICFDMSSNYLQSIDRKGKYFKRYRDSIKFDKTKSLLQILSSDSSHNDGYNSYCFVLDECHAQPDSRLWDVMCSSQGMRTNPLAIIITTAGFNKFGFCYNYRNTCTEILSGTKENDAQFAAIYTLDDEDDYTNPEVWIKSNPSLGITVQESYLQQQVQNAKNNSSLEVGIKTKNFNQWVSSADVWINNDTLLGSTKSFELSDFSGATAYVGVDLAAVSDLTAVSVMIPSDGIYYFKNFYYMPQSALSENSNSELYKEWKRKGLLRITSGNVTDYDYVLSDILRANEDVIIYKIAYDSYNATQWAISATEQGLPLEPFSQALWHFNRSTKEFERLTKMGKVVIDNNEITRWCFANVGLKSDHNDNVKPVKISDQQKIDGVIAMLEALGTYLETDHYDNKIG